MKSFHKHVRKKMTEALHNKFDGSGMKMFSSKAKSSMIMRFPTFKQKFTQSYIAKHLNFRVIEPQDIVKPYVRKSRKRQKRDKA